jgi:hypothetical protein
MSTPTLLPFAAAALIAAGMGAAGALRAWRDWLALRREEIAARGGPPRDSDVATLRARVRRLEAIASGVEL